MGRPAYGRPVDGKRGNEGFLDILMDWLQNTEAGEILWTMLVSMIPIIELRVGLPFGVALGLKPSVALCAAVVGNMIPVPFIIVYIHRVLHWLRVKSGWLDKKVSWLEKRAHLKGAVVTEYGFIGLYILVAIPLPGTGAWTGALAAACLDMPLKKALPAIFLGVVTAGLIVSIITYGVTAVL
jgi:uncharacterized membrane protein